MAPSKTFNIAGLATSFVIIPDKGIRQQFDHFLRMLHLKNGNLFGNIALEAAYHFGMEWVDQQNKYLEANRDLMYAFFRDKMTRIKMTPMEATYLAWLDFREYDIPEAEMNRLLIDKVEIVLNKGSIYGKEGEGFFRLNFACPRQVLEEALSRMEAVLGG
jgi:cystathionine beta-lyase